MMEFLNLLSLTILMMVFMLITMAFFTLLEQKVLSNIQIRKGPVFTGYAGMLQPFSDAIKLLTKENIITLNSNKFFFLISPLISLTLSFLLWTANPSFFSLNSMNVSLFYFFFISGLAVMPVLVMGWSSNCKYSMMGSLRSVSQMVSYEAVMSILLLSLFWMVNTLSFSLLMNIGLMSIVYYGPFCMIWLCVMLAETNRTPYDFSEGGSELVSGFITEYGSYGFTLVFMSEYLNILFMSLIFILMLMSSVKLTMGLYLIIVGFLFIWVRASLPRFRYDKLMGLVWKNLLPFCIFFFFFFFNLGLVGTYLT